MELEEGGALQYGCVRGGQLGDPFGQGDAVAAARLYCTGDKGMKPADFYKDVYKDGGVGAKNKGAHHRSGVPP
jgi:hypothetical protein